MQSMCRDEFVCNRALVIVCSAAVFVASWFYAPYVDHGPTICALRGLTGIPCPSCGLTRAFCDIVHGHFAGAAVHNAVAFPLAVLFLGALIIAPLELVLGRRISLYRWLYSTRVAYIFGGMVALYFVTRVALLCASGQLLRSIASAPWTFGLYHHLFR
jgi:hypothetical protein